MKGDLLRHLKNQHPAVDVFGKWACFGNAKTAQKSIMLNILGERQIKYDRGWRNWRRIWDYQIAPRIDDVFLFTIVRNPWDKVLSAYCMLTQRKGWPDEGFQHFVTQKLGITGPSIDKHFHAQAPNFLWRGQFIDNMFVGRFEQLQQDWEWIAGQIGATAELPHVNASEHGHYREYYDRESRDIVAELYRTEIEALGYEY